LKIGKKTHKCVPGRQKGRRHYLIYRGLRTSLCSRISSTPQADVVFVVVKGCVNFDEMTSVHKNTYLHAESFRKWERFLKTTASLSNLIPPCLESPTSPLQALLGCCMPQCAGEGSGTRQKPKTNLQTDEFASNPPFSKN